MQFDLFNEISILEMLPETCASKLLDYGINRENVVLVQRRYRASLSAWRQRQPVNPGPQLRLYFNIFTAVLKALKVSRATILLLASTKLTTQGCQLSICYSFRMSRHLPCTVAI